MHTYIEYQLDGNTTILVEAPEEKGRKVVRSSAEKGDVVKMKAKKSFGEALKEIRVQAKFLLNEIEELNVQEAEVKFGINTVGELGNMAIGKIGVGVNYEVTLKWRRPEENNK